MFCYILLIFPLLLLCATFSSTFSFIHSIAWWSCWILHFFICRKERNELKWRMTVWAGRHYLILSTKTKQNKPSRIHTSLESYTLKKKRKKNPTNHTSLFLIVLMWTLLLTAFKLSSNCVNTKEWNILTEIEIPFLLAHSYVNMVKNRNDPSVF